MKKSNLIGIFLLIIIVVLIVFVVVKLSFGPGEKTMSPYSAVYLETGDIYFGKLKHFPQLQMTEVWLIQRTVNSENTANLSIVPFTGAFWGPIDKIKLNPDKVIFSSRLRKDSQMVKVIENPEALNQTPSQN